MSLLKDKIELEIEEAEVEAGKRLRELSGIVRWFFIFCAVGIIPGFFIAKAISHGVWVRNYNQYLIASHASFAEPLPPAISDTTITTSGQGSYSAVASITNENLDLSLDGVPYSYTFLNQKGEVVHTNKGTLFLLPNQKKYIVVPRIVTAETITSANLEIGTDLPWQKRLYVPEVSLLTGKPQTINQSEPVTFIVEGDVQNNSPYNLGKIHLVFILRDADKKIIGASERNEFTVKPFERRGYRQLWPQIYGTTVASVEVKAETNTLDNANLVLPEQTATPASSLVRPSVRQ